MVIDWCMMSSIAWRRDSATIQLPIVDFIVHGEVAGDAIKQRLRIVSWKSIKSIKKKGLPAVIGSGDSISKAFCTVQEKNEAFQTRVAIRPDTRNICGHV